MSYPVRMASQALRCHLFIWVGLLGALFGSEAAAAPEAPAAAGGRIAGVVRTRDGRPVAGVLVAAVPADPERFEHPPTALGRSRPDGSFSLGGLPAGEYALTATAPQQAAAYQTPSPVGPGRDLLRVVLTLGGTGATISGVVTDAGTGTPLARAQVHALRTGPGKGDVFYTACDEHGAYTITLPPANYGMLAVVPGYEAAIQGLQLDRDRALALRLARVVPPGPAPAPVVAWLRDHAVRLATPAAGHGFADLQPLRAMIGDAQVVALGEATHGTREFYQLKHRVFEYLVTELGFTVLGIEGPMAEGFDVNHYLLTGEGDPVKALGGLYNWLWSTEEFLDLLRWMRRYNADPRHPRKVKLYGFDMQNWVRPLKRVRSYLQQVASAQRSAAPSEGAALSARAEQVLSPLLLPFAPSLGELPKARVEAIAALLRDVIAHLDRHRVELSERTGADAWSLARQHARLCQQALESDLGQVFRDQAMAENVQWILRHEGPGTKMALWAHNGHVTTAGFGSMGDHLRAALFSRLVVIGLTYHQGAFLAVGGPMGAREGPYPFTGPAAPAGSLDQTLAAAGLRYAALDLRAAPQHGEVGAWFAAPHRTHNIGAVFEGTREAASYFESVQVGTRYDALLFVERTTAIRPLPGSNRVRIVPPLAAPVNLDFEQGEPGQVPTGWHIPEGLAQYDWQVATRTEEPRQGRRCAELRRDPGRHYGEASGSLSQTIDATPWRGQRVRLQAAVRAAAGDADSHVVLWLRSQGARAAQPPAVQAIPGGPWGQYGLVLEVPADAQTLNYGLRMSGVGRAWLDAVSLERAGDPPAPTAPYERRVTTDRLGRQIVYYVATPRAPAAALPLAVFVQGSGCDSLFLRSGGEIVTRMHDLLRQALGARARLVVVEKPGVEFLDEAIQLGVAEGCRPEFLQEHTLPRWAEAVGAVVRAAAQLPQGDPRRVLVVGHSEGGIVAARVAAEDRAVTHVASLAGGGPSQLFDLVSMAGKRGEEVHREFRAVQQDPESTEKFWAGHPHRRWSSFLGSSVLDGLLRTEARVYLAQGAEDLAVSVVGFDVLRAELLAHGRQVTAERIAGVGHMFCPNAQRTPAGMRALLGRVGDWFLR